MYTCEVNTIRFILALKKKGLLSCCLPSGVPVINDGHLVFDVCSFECNNYLYC